MCFIAEIFVYGAEGSGPKTIEAYSSSVTDRWDLIETFDCSRDECQ